MPATKTAIQDATMVLALRMNEETIELYRTLTQSRRGRKLSDETLLGNVIVVPVDADASWGWMDKDYFDSLYEPMENWSKTRFTTCVARNGEDSK